MWPPTLRGRRDEVFDSCNFTHFGDLCACSIRSRVGYSVNSLKLISTALLILSLCTIISVPAYIFLTQFLYCPSCRYFNAELTPPPGSKATGAANVEAYLHEGIFYWTLNTTKTAKRVETLQIVDGKGNTQVVALILDTFTPPLSGAKIANGSTDGTDLNPAVAADLYELAGHMCMGHIYALVTTPSGDLQGPFVYQPEDGVTDTCANTVAAYAPSGMNMEGMVMGPSPSPAPVPPSGATSIRATSLSMAFMLASLFFFAH